MDQLNAMKIFVAVVDEAGFGAAAEKLNLSRTKVSKQVMDLEAHLSARLLNRTTRRQSLTGTGRAYYERAKRILNEIEEADAEAANQSMRPRGQLRINAPMAYGISHVAPNLRGYMDRYPEVEVDLTLNDRLVDLVDEGYDMAIRIGALSDSSLIARRIAVSHMVACAAPSYLAEHGTPHHPEDLRDHACLAYTYVSNPSRWQFTTGTETIAVNVAPRLVSNNGDAIAAAAISGLGIIVQPSFIVDTALADGRLVEILSGFDAGGFGIHAVYPSGRLVSARVRTFIDYLVTCAGTSA